MMPSKRRRGQPQLGSFKLIAEGVGAVFVDGAMGNLLVSYRVNAYSLVHPMNYRSLLPFVISGITTRLTRFSSGRKRQEKSSSGD